MTVLRPHLHRLERLLEHFSFKQAIKVSPVSVLVRDLSETQKKPMKMITIGLSVNERCSLP